MFGRRVGDMNMLFIIILIMFALSSASFDLYSTLLTLPGLILALTVHEFAHAKMSDRLGDPTPEAQGRLTLNPTAHLDLWGTLFIVFAGFGWGKPVQIDERYYRNPARDTMLVALAGPLSNFIQSIFCFFVLGGILTFAKVEGAAMQILCSMIASAASINLTLGVFNLLPLPPLDGSKILRYFLHGRAREFLYTMEQYSMIILMVLFMTDLSGKIIFPIINLLGNGILWAVDAFWGLF